ncbi:MAG: hypothetical protein IT441_10880 [Phycisphaeraceae bacterium]|nr:hypothetical protein [Phycisphaeraceae bacterium]
MGGRWGKRLWGGGWPWGLSLMLHVGAAVVAMGVVWSVARPSRPRVAPIPVVELATAELGMPKPAVAAPQPVPTPTTPTADKPAEPDTPPPELKAPVEPPPAVLTPPPPQAVISPLAELQSTDKLEARFYGTGGEALRIVYVVDASASLVDTLRYVLDELERSVGRLQPAQQFTVIFFQEGKSLEPTPGGLRRATRQNIHQAVEWFKADTGNVRPRGSGPLVEAVAKALSYDPDLIFVLSDNLLGPVPASAAESQQRAILDEIHQLNDQKTMINAIQFVYQDPLAAAGKTGTLERLAKESGGTYRFISAKDLGIE